MLQKAEVTCISAINGLEALEIVQKSEVKFDFIILDLNMPILDGYEAGKKIIDHYNDDGKILASRENSTSPPAL
jgi:two-component system sensor histidine kinase/response regulator